MLDEMDGSDHPDGHSDEPSRKDALQSVRESASTNTPKRRSVLKTSLASGLAAVGFTGAASALNTRARPISESELASTQAAYDTDAKAINAFNEQGAALLTELADAGYIETASAAAFDSDSLSVHIVGIKEQATAHISLKQSLPDGEVTAVVEPETGREYAFIDESDAQTIMNSSGAQLLGCYNTTDQILDYSCTCDGFAYPCGTWTIGCCDTDCLLKEFQGCYGCCATDDCSEIC